MKRFGRVAMWTATFDVTRFLQPAWWGQENRSTSYRHGFALRVGPRRVVGMTW